MLHLASLDQVLYRACDVFDGHIRVNPVLIKQIDGLNPESLERVLGDPFDMLWTAVQPAQILSFDRVQIEAELGGDHHFSLERLDPLAHQFFVGEWTIDFSGVEEGDATLNRLVKKSDHLLLVGNWVFIMAHSHAT